MEGRPSRAIPIAIILAGLIIGGSVYLVFRSPSGADDARPSPEQGAKQIPDPVATEHILGSPTAPIVVIEYTDLECPYCKTFHQTMKFLMDDYGKKGQLAWVVRHFPIPQLHPKAPKEHEAAECAAELGGNSAFFAYIDKVFERTPSNNGLDLALLPVIAGEIGLDKAAFTACLESSRYAEMIKNQAAEAFASGAQGTPHSVVVFQNEKLPLPGAQPYKTMRSMIDALLLRAEGNTSAIPPAQF